MNTPTSSSSDGVLPPLSGWKDIAAYLGKSVRAVQRWERDHHLPVHRIKTATGQVVYAFASEIDAWRAGFDPQPELAGGSGNTSTPVDFDSERAGEWPPAKPAGAAPHDDVPVRTVGNARRIRLVAAALTCAAVLLTGGLLLREPMVGQPPSQVIVSGDSLVALSRTGATLWSYSLGSVFGHDQAATRVVSHVQGDTDGDGSPETFVVVRSPETNGQPWRETLYCLSLTGRLRWSYTPSLKLSFGGRSFEGPWRSYGLVVSDRPGRQRVWAAYAHHTLWPSFVVELTADGKAVPKYFHAGPIYTLAYWSTDTGDYLVAGGISTAHGQASVSVLELDGRTATSPQDAAGSDFKCETCPEEGPRFFALLPRTEVSRVGGGAYSSIANVRAMGRDCFVSTVEDAARGGGAVFFLGSDFSFREAGLDDQYWEIHRLYQRMGRIAHGAEDCPDVQNAHAIQTWNPSRGWSTEICRLAGPVPGTQPSMLRSNSNEVSVPVSSRLSENSQGRPDAAARR